MIVLVLLATQAGSHVLTFEARTGFAGLMQEPAFVFPQGSPANCRDANGDPITAVDAIEARAFGVGGGAGARVGYMFTSLGKQTGTVWGAFRAAGGIDILYMHQWSASTLGCNGTGADLELRPQYTNGGSYYLHIPIAVGGVIGIGRPRPGTSWSGLAIGLAYAPSLNISPAGVGFYYAGAELTFDFLINKLMVERDPSFRLAFTVLPPLSGLPLFGGVSFGAAWF